MTKIIKHLLWVLILLFAFGSSARGQAQMSAIPYEIAPIQAPFEMPQLQRPVFPDRVYDIRDFGAVPVDQDPGFINTPAIHRAIEAAHANGGGKVLVPPGEWLTGPVHLMSHVNFHLSEGSTLKFSTRLEDYLPVVRQRHNGVECYNYSPMIYAFEVKNTAITGKGVMDAQSDRLWWEWASEFRGSPRERRVNASKLPLSRRVNFCKGSGQEGERPSFVVFWKSEDLLLEDFTLVKGPMWNVQLIYSQRAIIRGITVNSLEAANGDGIVLDSSRDILVEYVRLMTGDDAVVLKSGLNEEGLSINIPTENVVVRNFEAIDVRTGSGGIVFGSETSGGIRNVYVHDAYFDGSDRGIRFKSRRARGNVIENITIRSIRLRNISFQGINFNSYYGGPGETGPAPLFRNIHISNIDMDGVPTAIEMIGLPEKWIENITLENIRAVNTRAGIRMTRVNNVTLRNVHVESDERAMVADDVYEMHLDQLHLEDRAGGLPLLLVGRYTGAIFRNGYSRDLIERGEEVSERIFLD